MEADQWARESRFVVHIDVCGGSLEEPQEYRIKGRKASLSCKGGPDE